MSGFVTAPYDHSSTKAVLSRIRLLPSSAGPKILRRGTPSDLLTHHALCLCEDTDSKMCIKFVYAEMPRQAFVKTIAKLVKHTTMSRACSVVEHLCEHMLCTVFCALLKARLLALAHILLVHLSNPGSHH